MGYRDDREAMNARVEHLETELAVAKAELRAVGKAWAPARKDNILLGGPSAVNIEFEIPGALSERGLEEVTGLIRREFGVGQIDRMGRTLAWRSDARGGRMIEMMVEVRDDRTTLRLNESFKNLAGGLFGGVVGGLGGGGLGAVLPLATFLLGVSVAAPLLGLGWVALVYAGTRVGYRSISNGRAEVLETLAQRIEAAAHADIARSENEDVRVDLEEGQADEDVEAENATSRPKVKVRD